MQLLIYITNQKDMIPPIIKKMAEKDIHGATSVDCEGMLQSLYGDQIEPPPIFSSLRRFVNPDHELGKMLFLVVDEESLKEAKTCIHEVCGDLDTPNSGILFTIPVLEVEGVTVK